MLFTLILSVGVTSPQGAVAESPCVASTSQLGDQVQLKLMTLDAGLQTFEVYRLPRHEVGDWARWTSAGHLLAYGALPAATTYEHITNAIASAPPATPTTDPAGPLGRAGFNLTLLQVADTVIHQRQLDSVPPALADLIEDWRQAQTASPLEHGWYLWTSPVPAHSSAAVDVDLTEGPCRDTLETSLAKALAEDRLILPASQAIEEFVSGERAYRTTFSARIPKGMLHFGILTVP